MRLAEHQENGTRQRSTLTRLPSSFPGSALPVLVGMEHGGARIDWPGLKTQDRHEDLLILTSVKGSIARGMYIIMPDSRQVGR